MTDPNSILDKIIESKQIQDASQFDPNEILSNLFKNLSSKERDIVHRRFGLAGKKRETLEQIGKYYDITRERIRQIESGTIRKIKEMSDFGQHIEPAERSALQLLENYGGAMEEQHFLEQLLTYGEDSELNRQASTFILNHLLNEKVEYLRGNNELNPGWKLQAASLDVIKRLVDELAEIIARRNTLLSHIEMVEALKKSQFYSENPDFLFTYRLDEKPTTEIDEEIGTILSSLLRLSKKISYNILGEWGLSHWNTVTPKRMSDKVYLVLKQATDPQHFTEITNLINRADFDRKTAYPATVHNELILDDRYVLVGRGIYALKEWGYTPGTVIDIIIEILKKEPEGLTKEEIVKRVLEQRIVRKSTIYLALTNKEKIKRLGNGRYGLAAIA